MPGNIRVIDGLTVEDLLALRRSGWFQDRNAHLPRLTHSDETCQPEPLKAVPPPKDAVGAAPPPVASPDAKAEEPRQTGPAASTAPQDVPTPEMRPDEPTALPRALLEATGIRQVVEYVRAHGYETEEKITAKCEELKERVPALKPVRNLAVRVRQVLETSGG